MAELDAGDVIGNRIFCRRDLEHIMRGHIEKLDIWFDEPPDQPRTSYAVDLRALARDSLHEMLLSFEGGATAQLHTRTC